MSSTGALTGDRVPSTVSRSTHEPIVYYQGSDGYCVRSMTSQDALTVAEWYTATMGTSSVHDLQIALDIWPPESGFFVGEKDGQLISSAIRIPCGGGVAYGSMYYVIPGYRKRGYGCIIRDQVATKHAGENIICIDSVMSMAGTNRKLGYVEAEYSLCKYDGIAKLVTIDEHCRKITPSMIDDIICYDNKCYITENDQIRRRFLKEWTQIPGGCSYSYINNAGDVIGYGCRRPTMRQTFHKLGPLYADSKYVAERLVEALTRDIAGQTFMLFSSMANKRATELATNFNMKREFECVRMTLNGNLKNISDKVYGVTSIDVCGF